MDATTLLLTGAAAAGALYLLLFLDCVAGRRHNLHRQRRGLALNQRLKELIQELQQHRGMSNALLSGDASFAPRLRQRQGRIEALLIRGGEALREEGGGFAEGWNELTGQWRALVGSLPRIDAPRSFREHTRLIGTVLELLRKVGDESTLTLDESSSNRRIADVLVNRLPALTEQLGQARALGSAAAAGGRVSTVAGMRLRFTAEQAREALDAVAGTVDRLERSDDGNDIARRFAACSNDTRAFLELLRRELIERPIPTIKPEEYFAAASRAIDAGYALFEAMAPTLDHALERRVERIETHKRWITTGVGGSLLGGLGGFLFLAG